MPDHPAQPRPKGAGQSNGWWLSPKQVAIAYGVSRQWVYENKAKLGYTKMGDGRGARLRFDRTDVERFMEARYHEAHDRVERPDAPRKVSPPRRIITHID